MKLLLIFAFLALIYIAQSAPTSSSTDRSLVLQDYYSDDESDSLEEKIIDETTTQSSTRPPRSSISAISWLDLRTSTVTTPRNDDEYDDQNEFDGYLRNIRQFFKKVLEDLRKLLKNITGYDIVQAIEKYFKRKAND
ncbi:unnamed protein product [Rotaria sp. Silwood2]|nr:unnamed protein product [Rotaria sp. Silwood2]CAF4033996.1 unnamed protein product [Rotaria sp. Silwood2]